MALLSKRRKRAQPNRSKGSPSAVKQKGGGAVDAASEQKKFGGESKKKGRGRLNERRKGGILYTEKKALLASQSVYGGVRSFGVILDDRP